MHQRDPAGSTKVLWGMLLLAAAYFGLLQYLRSFTGIPVLDGSIGVVLGLYICSHPAANAVDAFYLARGVFGRILSGWPGIRWLALNLLVILAGWLVIVSGATQFVG